MFLLASESVATGVDRDTAVGTCSALRYALFFGPRGLYLMLFCSSHPVDAYKEGGYCAGFRGVGRIRDCESTAASRGAAPLLFPLLQYRVALFVLT